MALEMKTHIDGFRKSEIFNMENYENERSEFSDFHIENSDFRNSFILLLDMALKRNQ